MPPRGLRLALANVFHDCDVFEKGSGVWTDALDDALRAAAAQALGRWLRPCCSSSTLGILPDFAWDRGVVEGATRLVKTLDESPAIIAAFTGHRHINRITAYRDYLVVDTACLIGFPLGYRCVTLSADGFFKDALPYPQPARSAARFLRPLDARGESGLGRPHPRPRRGHSAASAQGAVELSRLRRMIVLPIASLASLRPVQL